MRKLNPVDLASKTFSVATLPDIYLRINEVVNDPSSSFADVANVIREDVGLSSRLLRLVNSAFFGFPSKIDSISRACVIVGTLQLRSLALATSVIDTLFLRQGEALLLDGFWRHSIGCGVASSALARHLGHTDVERFFVAGLLHDIGRIIFMNEAPEEAATAMQEAQRTERMLYQVEYESFGFTHAEVCGALLQKWGLPATLVDPVTWHHGAGGSMAYIQESACLQAGNMIAHALGLGGKYREKVPPARAEVLEMFSGLADRMDLLLDQVVRQYEEVSLLMLDGV
jgi:putative nucleotidyltransferase with HDIG domain